MALDPYTRGTVKRTGKPSRVITMPGNVYAVAGVKGLYTKTEAEALAAKLDGEA
jgi:hypothetical protein